MRQGIVKYNGIRAGLLTEEDNGEYLIIHKYKYTKSAAKALSTTYK